MRKWGKLKFVFMLFPTFQDMSVAAKVVVLGQLDALKAKCEEAVEARKKAEQDIENLRPVGKQTSGMSFKSDRSMEKLI